jgi:hypothetical protein
MTDLAKDYVQSDRREQVQSEFGAARRELAWCQDRYGAAQHAMETDAGSPFDLHRARLFWAEALTEWVRALVAREEFYDRPRTPAAGPAADTRPTAVLPLRRARTALDRANGDYEDLRHGKGNPADVDAARLVWSRALTRWAQALIAREEAGDRARVRAAEDRETAGPQIVLADDDAMRSAPARDAGRQPAFSPGGGTRRSQSRRGSRHRRGSAVDSTT